MANRRVVCRDGEKRTVKDSYENAQLIVANARKPEVEKKEEEDLDQEYACWLRQRHYLANKYCRVVIFLDQTLSFMAVILRLG